MPERSSMFPIQQDGGPFRGWLPENQPSTISPQLISLTSSRFLRTLAIVSMTRIQFWILNIIGSICALLILASLILSPLNSRLSRQVAATQTQFNQAQQLQNTAQNLLVRIAQAGQTDPSLRQLLAKYDFQVTLNQTNQANQSNHTTPASTAGKKPNSAP
jgi:hypothetical protein